MNMREGFSNRTRKRESEPGMKRIDLNGGEALIDKVGRQFSRF
jgi:hypothetical protein